MYLQWCVFILLLLYITDFILLILSSGMVFADTVGVTCTKIVMFWITQKIRICYRLYNVTTDNVMYYIHRDENNPFAGHI